MVVRDLLGPAGGEVEELTRAKTTCFSVPVGMLAPKASDLPWSRWNELATEED